MRNWGRFICCLLLLTATTGCPWDRSGNDDHDEEINVSSYARFQTGATWKYKMDSDSSNTDSLAYGAPQAVEGYAGNVHVLSDGVDNRMYFAQDIGSRLSLLGTFKDGPYKEGLPLLRDSFNPDDEYGPYETDDSDCRARVTYQKTSFRSPYYDHTFDDAVLTTVRTTCNSLSNPGKVERYWFVEDVGLVGWTDPDGDVWYLDDYN